MDKLPLNQLPAELESVTPDNVYNAVLDAAAEFGKIDPRELDIGALMGLAMVYGGLRGIVEGVRLRRSNS